MGIKVWWKSTDKTGKWIVKGFGIAIVICIIITLFKIYG